MLVQDKVTGVIELVNKIGGPFTADDRDLLTTIAASAAIAIENARLYELAVDRGRLEREIQVAAEVQASLIPAAPPHIPGFEIGTLWQPARQAAGDFYDFVALDDDRQAFIVADVSDKGLAAAFFMALCRSILRSSIVSTRPHADRIKKANQLICADAAANGMFVTAFFAVLDPRSRELFYVNAGHNPPMLYRAATGAMDVLPRTGIALGVLEESDYREGRVQLNPGDVLVMYTDGVTEAMNEREEPFEEPRLVQVIRDKCVSAAEVACGLDAALKEFVGTHAPHDDITVVVIKCAA
jgi:sigma-B regulation protein RsbU (phosphoserine phosphatase)